MAEIHETIASLLGKTTQSGASESEAMAAISMAHKLMSKYGITAEELNRAKTTYNKADFTDKSPSNSSKLSIIDNYLATTIANFTGTKIFLRSCQTGWKYSPRAFEGAAKKVEQRIVYFGYRVDVELANLIYNVVINAVENEWKRFSVRLKVGERRAARNSFQLAMVCRIRERLESMMTDSDATGTDLIILKHQIVEQAFHVEYTMKQERSSTYVSKVKVTDTGAAVAGYIAGDRVELNRKVDDQNTRTRVLQIT